jgi:hypothetical protein
LCPHYKSLKKKRNRKGTLPNSFYEASVTPIPKPEKDTTTTKIESRVQVSHICNPTTQAAEIRRL